MECPVGGAVIGGPGFCEKNVCVRGSGAGEHVSGVGEHRTGQDAGLSAETRSLSRPLAGSFHRGLGRF